jgi:hypothetical protein
MGIVFARELKTNLSNVARSFKKKMKKKKERP